MKNKVKYLLLTLSLVTLSACGQKANSDLEKEETESEKVVVASVGSDAAIWKFIATSAAAKEAGLEIEVKEITGGPITNQATADGDVDCAITEIQRRIDLFCRMRAYCSAGRCRAFA